jgi:hypothetical protein
VRVACNDLQGDGRYDIVAGMGPGKKPRVKVFTGLDAQVIADFLAYGKNFTGGVYVATGNVTGTAFADLIVGRGAGGDPLVKVFSNNPEQMHSHDADHDHGRSARHAAPPIQPADHPDEPLDLVQICQFLAYGASYTGGVRVTSMQTQFTVEDENNFFFQLSRDDIVTTRATGSVEALARFTC